MEHLTYVPNINFTLTRKAKNFIRNYIFCGVHTITLLSHLGDGFHHLFTLARYKKLTLIELAHEFSIRAYIKKNNKGLAINYKPKPRNKQHIY